MSRWWKRSRESAYAPGWLSGSGAPHRFAKDLDGVVHFVLGDPKVFSMGYQNHPGYTACDVAFCWEEDFRGEKDDPVPMIRMPLVKMTCVLCIGAF